MIATREKDVIEQRTAFPVSPRSSVAPITDAVKVWSDLPVTAGEPLPEPMTDNVSLKELLPWQRGHAACRRR